MLFILLQCIGDMQIQADIGLGVAALPVIASICLFLDFVWYVCDIHTVSYIQSVIYSQLYIVSYIQSVIYSRLYMVSYIQ